MIGNRRQSTGFPIQVRTARLRKVLNLVFVFVVLSSVPKEAYAENQQDHPLPTQLGIFIGSLRTPYASLVTGIDLQTGHFGDLPLRLDARLTSRGVWYLLNPFAFDLEAALLYDDTDESGGLSAGLGYKLYARFSNDERSNALTSYAPFIRGSGRIAFITGPTELSGRLILDLALFNNGFSIGLGPQLSLGIDWFFVAIDLKGEYLFRVWGNDRNTPDNEFRWDSFLTLGVRFN